MDVSEKLLLPAVVVLAGVIAYLWRIIEATNANRNKELDRCRKERDAAWRQLARIEEQGEDSDPEVGAELER